jgi:hypothetical protein
MPVILVCIHDNADPLCQQPAFGVTIPDPQCSALLDPPENTMDGWTAGTEQSRYVEVRICYRFSMLINVVYLPLDDVWLQKARVFTVAYFPPPTPSPPPPPDPPPPEELPTPTPTPTPEEPTPTPTPTPEEPTPTPTPEEPTPTPAPDGPTS